jgi:inner membrane protein
MNQTGHHITAAAMAAAGAAVALPSTNILQLSVGIIAVLAGASAPDWLEGLGPIRILPHRTFTHIPWVWVVLIVVGTLNIHSLYGIALMGFSAAALLHLLMDAMSPMGIPIWTPFERRKSLHAYRVGGISEAITILTTSGLFTGIAVLAFI